MAVPDLKLPRTYQWNIAVEQSLGSGQSLSLTYVGALGRDLLRQTALNPAAGGNSNFVYVYPIDNTATSDYNALQVKFQRRLSRGLQALASCVVRGRARMQVARASETLWQLAHHLHADEPLVQERSHGSCI